MSILLGILILLSVCVYGQENLVPNGDFESHESFPENSNLITVAVPWTGTGFTPDYFHADCPPIFSDPYCSVPENNRGNQYPRSGSAYAGIHTFSWNSTDGREFLQIELIEPIVAGIRYEVAFYVSLADDMRYAVRTMGVHFRQSPLHRFEYSISDLDIEAHAVNQSDSPLTDKEEWVLVKDTFNSRIGGEQFLLLGNFHLDGFSDTLLLESGTNLHSYYYIDDVSVIALDSIPNSIVEAERLSFSVFPNPATEVLHIRSGQPLARLRLLDISGRAVLTEHIATDRYTLPLAGIPPGLYLLDLTDAQGRRALQKLVVQ